MFKNHYVLDLNKEYFRNKETVGYELAKNQERN